MKELSEIVSDLYAKIVEDAKAANVSTVILIVADSNGNMGIRHGGTTTDEMRGDLCATAALYLNPSAAVITDDDDGKAVH